MREIPTLPQRSKDFISEVAAHLGALSDEVLEAHQLKQILDTARLLEDQWRGPRYRPLGVKKDTEMTFDLRNGDAWASIFLTSTSSAAWHYGGQLDIRASMGDFAQSWAGLDVPLEEYLLSDAKSGGAWQCLGRMARCYDGNGTLSSVEYFLIQMQADKVLTLQQAEVVYEHFMEHKEAVLASPAGFLGCVSVLSKQKEFEDLFVRPYLLICEKSTRSAVDFETLLWPLFKAQLADHCTPALPKSVKDGNADHKAPSHPKTADGSGGWKRLMGAFKRSSH